MVRGKVSSLSEGAEPIRRQGLGNWEGTIIWHTDEVSERGVAVQVRKASAEKAKKTSHAVNYYGKVDELRKISSREARRMMQRMGLSMTPMPDVQEVIVRTSTKEIVIKNPEVSVLDLHGQKIFQVAGGDIAEKTVERKLAIPEEDVQLVAQQANVSLDQARAALEETKGDLAQAILLLTQK